MSSGSGACRDTCKLDRELDRLTSSPIGILSELVALAKDHITEQLSADGIAVYWKTLHEPMLIEHWFHDLVISSMLFRRSVVRAERLILGEHLEKITEAVRSHSGVIFDVAGSRRAYLDALTMDVLGLGTDEIKTRVHFKALRRGVRLIRRQL